MYTRNDDNQMRSVPVLPQVLQQPVLSNLHDKMGHLGFNKTIQQIKRRFYWPGLHTDVKKYIEGCKRCALRKSPDGKRSATLQNIKTSRPLQLICIDFLSLEKSSGVYEHLLVITDHFTRYAQAYPTRDQTATTVAKVLWQKFLVNYGIPERIHSDQGREFCA